MKKNPQLLILIGAPGSGKTTFAAYQVRTNTNWMRVSRDDLRNMQFSKTFLSEAQENAITKLLFAGIEALLLQKINIIVDATHTKANYLEEYIEQFGHLADIAFKMFEAPFSTLQSRCENREAATGQHIPNKAILHHMQALESLKACFDFSVRPKKPLRNLIAPQKRSLPKAIICDLDGTLALMDDRNPFDASRAENDRLNSPVATTLRLYKENGYQVLLVSGRSESYRTPTIKFLANHRILYDVLWMRPQDNYKKDSIIKREIYDQYIRDQYAVELVLDDRDQVVDMWRKQLQLPCFQVFYGKF